MGLGNQLEEKGLHNLKRQRHKEGQKKYWIGVKAYIRKHEVVSPPPKEEVEERQKELQKRAMNLRLGFRASIRNFLSTAFRKH